MANTLLSPKAGDSKPRAIVQDRDHRRWRFIAIAIASLAMAFGLWTGLQRLGLPLPEGPLPPSELHGALMTAGFFGTVISLERAVALGRWWAYGAPALSAAGALLLIANVPAGGAALFLAASLALLVATGAIAVRQFALFTFVLVIAAACWGVGALQWLTGLSLPEVTGWWLSFLVLTIAAERLELSRILRVSLSSQLIFLAFVLLLLVGAVRNELAYASAPFTAVGLTGLAAWLLIHDIARRTIRQAGQAKFSALCILAGHVWLAAAGAVLLLAPSGAVTFAYDAAVHAIGLGFVMSMVFGHAPIILPAVIGVRVQFSRAAYAPLALLHAAVALRVAADVYGLFDLRAASGLLTVVALAGYAATLIVPSRPRSALN
jgi:hypothetical protein